MQEPGEDNPDGGEMSHIKSEDPFESFKEKSTDSCCNDSGSSMNFYFWDKFIERKENEESQ